MHAEFNDTKEPGKIAPQQILSYIWIFRNNNTVVEVESQVTMTSAKPNFVIVAIKILKQIKKEIWHY